MMTNLSQAFRFELSFAVNSQGTPGVNFTITEHLRCIEETLKTPGTKTLPPLVELLAIPTDEVIQAPRSVTLFCARSSDEARLQALQEHAASLTDSLIYYQWFKVELSKDERKAKQAAAKLAKQAKAP